jgi:DNA polymerase I-like protein with 3'-5' exonuclease and polymerase domains
LTFGITYGQGLKKIATQLGFVRKYKQEIIDAGGIEVIRRKVKTWVTLKSMKDSQLQKHAETLGKVEAKKYRDEYFTNMEGSRAFLNKVQKTIEARGWVKNRYGRVYKIEKDFAYKGINYLVQGTAADIINERIVEVDKYLKDKKSNVLLQVHDELLLEVHESEINEIPYQVKLIMEENTLDIPLRVEIEEFPVSWAVKESRVAIEGALLNCSQKEYDEMGVK